MNDAMYPLLGASARLSEDGVYRYELARRWAKGPMATFVMLNPSTADATRDDLTIRRCRGFAKAWDMGGIYVVNLFALRATDWRELRTAEDPVGPENDDAIHDAVVRSRVIVAAWGAKEIAVTRGSWVTELMREIGRNPLCLAKTRRGRPRHPLYVSGAARPIPYEPR